MLDPGNWEERHKQFNAGLDADQVERQAFLDGVANTDAGLEDERIAGIVDDSLVEKGNSWGERQVVLEKLSGPIAEELARRADLMGSAYPFSVNSGSVSYQSSRTGVYEFCLAVSRNPTGTAEGVPNASAIFEWISRDVLVAYLGEGAEGVRTGAPVYPFEHRGTRTRETFGVLEKRTGEFRWDPTPDYPDDPSPQYLKDAGLDVVGWKPWPDERQAPLFALGQCACGKNDVTVQKGRDLSLTRLGNWLRPVCRAAPLRCFFVAHHIPNVIHLYELSGEAGLVFDRARIALIAEQFVDKMKSAEGLHYHEIARLYATQIAA